jgi:hypothetical protein
MRWYHFAGLLAAWFSGATAGTLDTVKQRGSLVCGVSAGFASFPFRLSGKLQGLTLITAGHWRGSRRRHKVRYVALRRKPIHRA